MTMSIITSERGSMSLRRAGGDTAYGDHGLILLWQPSGKAAVEMSCTPQRTSRSSESEPSPRSMPDRCSPGQGSEVGLVVSGSVIRSTWPDSQYELSNGMSMATPFVTGAIALLLGSDEHA